MKIYEKEFRKQAKKFIESRSQKEKQRILEEIDKLPAGNDIKKMGGYENRYRLRIGGYRIVYEKHKDKLLVLVLEADNRGDIY